MEQLPPGSDPHALPSQLGSGSAPEMSLGRVQAQRGFESKGEDRVGEVALKPLYREFFFSSGGLDSSLRAALKTRPKASNPGEKLKRRKY